jgi:uncharacterized protein
MSRPFKLYRLQQIDSQLDWIKNRLADIDTALREDEQVRTARVIAEKADQNLQQAQKALRRAEDEVRSQRIKIEQSEASLYGGKIHNPKELKDLENEVASLKRFLSVLEDRQLEAMLAEEEALNIQRQAGQAYKQAQSEFEVRGAELIQEQQKISRDQARLEAERSSATGVIEPEDLAIYMQLRKNRRGVAVAKVVDRACSACGSTLNAALLNAVHSPNQLNLCDACGRVLYIG